MTVKIDAQPSRIAGNNEVPSEGASSPDFSQALSTNQHDGELDPSRIAKELGLPDDTDLIPRMKALAEHAGIAASSQNELVQALKNKAAELPGEQSVFLKILLGIHLNNYIKFLNKKDERHLFNLLGHFVGKDYDLDLLAYLINSTLDEVNLDQSIFNDLLFTLIHRKDTETSLHVNKFIDQLIDKLAFKSKRSDSPSYLKIFKNLLEIRGKVKEADKDAIDDAINCVLSKGKKAEFTLNDRQIEKLLENDSISEKVTEILLNGKVNPKTIKSLADKFPDNKILATKRKKIANEKLNKVIKLITEFAVFAFVFIGCTALGVLYPAVSVFTGIAGIALIMAFHWFLWNKV